VRLAIDCERGAQPHQAETRRLAMNKFGLIGLSALLTLGSAMPDSALGQQKSLKEMLVGTWLQVSVDVVSTDGTRRHLFGDNPKGIVIYTNDGYFSLMQASVTVPKIASGRPATATVDEAKAVVAGSIAYFGRYSLDEASRVLSVDIQASTFANQVGDPTEKRTITSLTDHELKFTRHGQLPNTMLEVVFKRAP
jgi:lipocalin-like protein